MSDSDRKVFDEWTDVDCNNCQRYWLDQCDGTKVNETKICNSFLATRKTDIPMQIKRLDKDLNWIKGVLIFYGIVILLLLIKGALF